MGYKNTSGDIQLWNFRCDLKKWSNFATFPKWGKYEKREIDFLCQSIRLQKDLLISKEHFKDTAIKWFKSQSDVRSQIGS